MYFITASGDSASTATGGSASLGLAIPDDVYMLLGLHEAITPQRLRGLHALVGYMKRQVRAEVSG